MSDINYNRPTEKHIVPVTSVERERLPLLASLVYGELHSSEMLNSKELGLKKPGIYSGFVLVPNGGMQVKVERDPELTYSSAMVQIGIQNITVIQQHDIEIEIPQGAKWFVVLKAFYEYGIQTRQVDINSDQDAANIVLVEENDLLPEHVVLGVVDTTAIPSEITVNEISDEGRVERVFSVDDHVDEDDPHPQYTTADESGVIASNAIKGVKTDDHTGDSSELIATQKALASLKSEHGAELATKVSKDDISQDHTESSSSKVPSSSTLLAGLSEKVDLDMLRDVYTSPQDGEVATIRALVTALTESKNFTSSEIARIMGNAPQETLDTFTEIAAKFADSDDAFVAIMEEISKKINSSSIVSALNSTSETEVLSAKAGKSLNDAKIDKSAISDSTELNSSENVASSKAVKVVADAKIDKASISDSAELDSSTNVASSKALRGGLLSRLATSLLSDRYDSNDSNGVASSKSVYDLYQVVKQRLTQTAADTRYALLSSLNIGAVANTIAKRDGAGDIQARLFRSNYVDEPVPSGGLAFRVDASNNYIRFCNNIANIRAWLSIYSKAEANTLFVDTFNETAGNITLVRKSRKQTVMRVGSADATITIDASTYQPGDIIDIYNTRDNSGVATITNQDGLIYVSDGTSASTHTFTGHGRLRLIKRASGNHFESFV